MSGVFRFKQFNVNQQGCAMKINTDGVLLGALAQAKASSCILDIGTGTGVIALMLAQRFADAKIDAVELDASAAVTATGNFEQSPYTERLTLFSDSFQDYFDCYPDRKYDLIVSNPPFYIHSLQSPGAGKALAKHADVDFFEELISQSAKHLHVDGRLWMILPINTAAAVRLIASQYNLSVQQIINIHSYPHDEAHRQILVFGTHQTEPVIQRFVIYDAPKQYSEDYQQLLKEYFTIF
ncbi:tRNA1(Val) (adenine(37)-N6)-methyltransferase [Mucilaginibacter lacusdianchii]|uniref:tRNA1(Val) (adenine(37)-N6)-methyltransferase n=1 Tax=Mucilaginibacter lacusdianchii TaxID=2684211 RepID=UPI00131B3BC6|nr:methyltransferase [Mucilaginibacter sp. JXJ CY 39]